VFQFPVSFNQLSINPFNSAHSKAKAWTPNNGTLQTNTLLRKYENDQL